MTYFLKCEYCLLNSSFNFTDIDIYRYIYTHTHNTYIVFINVTYVFCKPLKLLKHVISLTLAVTT